VYSAGQLLSSNYVYFSVFSLHLELRASPNHCHRRAYCAVIRKRASCGKRPLLSDYPALWHRKWFFLVIFSHEGRKNSNKIARARDEPSRAEDEPRCFWIFFSLLLAYAREVLALNWFALIGYRRRRQLESEPRVLCYSHVGSCWGIWAARTPPLLPLPLRLVIVIWKEGKGFRSSRLMRYDC